MLQDCHCIDGKISFNSDELRVPWKKLFDDVRGYSMLQMICHKFCKHKTCLLLSDQAWNDVMSIVVDNLYLYILNFFSDSMIPS